MRILEVLPGLSSGGAERLVVDLCNEFENLGHEVTLLSIKDLHLNKRDFYLPELSPNVKVINIKGSPGYLKTANEINNVIKKGSYDVIHGHLCLNYFLFPIIKWHKHKKFFITIHTDAKKVLGTDIKSRIIRSLLFNKISPIGWLQFITISEKNQKDIKTLFPKAKCKLIYNGRKHLRPTEKYDEVCCEITNLKHHADSIVFTHIARCVPAKNQSLLVDSINRLVSLGEKVELLMIGDGYDDTDIGKSLKSKACDNIHFLGTRNNVGDYLLNSDAFVLSSNYEGMPISLIEALSCGTPAICTPVCGALDVITPQINGIISKDFSIESYVDALSEFLIHRNELKINTQVESEKGKFDIHNTAQEYLKLFNS